MILNLVVTLNLNAQIDYINEKALITIDKDSTTYFKNKFKSRFKVIDENQRMTLIETDEEALPWLSLFMHKDYNRCGGFMRHFSLDEALEHMNSEDKMQLAQSSFFQNSYQIDRENEVQPMLENLNAGNILATITKLSSFQNRYYKGPHGKSSAEWIRSEWAKMSSMRSDVKVELFKHKNWDQPSVILTLQGISKDIIIIGGHQDSISGSFGGQDAKAPGADDNASGISTMTEVMRVLMLSNYKPHHTIKFMAYASEEVGLLGSKEIAKAHKDANENILGVMQLDMTNFKGTKDLDIVMMTDYTNPDQNKFLGTIIDTYVPGVKWGFDKCGYGCSDHASWFSQGYPTSMPFESKMRDMNKNIHTANDTLKASKNSADHALKFAKMALAFLVELDK